MGLLRRGFELLFRLIDPRPRSRRLLLAWLPVLAWVVLSVEPQGAWAHPWPTPSSAIALESRIAAPEGYRRVDLDPGSFGSWLRRLPALPGRPPVYLYNGALKNVQTAHHAVLAIDVGKRNLQQCADAVIRLRAEYLWQTSPSQVCFHFTNGTPARWAQFAAGFRPVVKGNRVRWLRRARPSHSYRTFRRYLTSVFAYAGTYSLERELKTVAANAPVQPGDVFIQGGFPGHAVIVLDVAIDGRDHRAFLLGQSYMPAQQMHVLNNPQSSSPWYKARRSGALQTPEWRFRWKDRRRFFKTSCAVGSARR